MELVCKDCGARYEESSQDWACKCGGVLDLLFNDAFPLEKIKTRPASLWRYREAIPVVDDGNIVSFGEGFTPLVEVEFSGRNVLLKLDFLFPSGSFKDRGATVLISKVKELGITRVVEDSSGNAGAAVATYCAGAGIDCEIFVPESSSTGKLAQISALGAQLIRISGTREAVAEAARERASSVYYASHCWNPFFLHGTKTVAFEIAEQMDWRAPETLVMPVGHGTLLLGAYIGFRELKAAEIIERLPKIIGVQAENCAPLYHAWYSNRQNIVTDELRPTIAEGIAIARPVRHEQIISAVNETDGQIVTVSEDEIKSALKKLCGLGFYVEPTSAVALAGLAKIELNREAVVPLTGHGLKAAEYMSAF